MAGGWADEREGPRKRRCRSLFKGLLNGGGLQVGGQVEVSSYTREGHPLPQLPTKNNEFITPAPPFK